MAKDDAPTFELTHPNGSFTVTVVGETRRDLLLGRGYTEGKAKPKGKTKAADAEAEAE